MTKVLETHRIPARNLPVREEMGLVGVREQQAELPELLQSGRKSALPRKVSSLPQFGGAIARNDDAEEQERIADTFQRRDTNVSWAPAPVYPAQMRLAETQREVVPKNHQEFELVGRNIGPHQTENAVGGYAGMDKVGQDLTEKQTQRTVDDFKEYFHPTAAVRFQRGSAAVYNQFDQNRIDMRELGYKDTPGRYPGAFRHDIRRPGTEQDELWQKGQYGALKPTMKRDYGIVHRQREDENPNREGLRVQYADVYSPEWNQFESLINPRRKQHELIREIDHSMLSAYHSGPYSQPIGIIPHAAVNNSDLNNEEWQKQLKGKIKTIRSL